MAITVRVQNFQSVVDATIVIDGFTVMTGGNNSGKTALMRAIQGVFTNAAAGPLVRHGCAHLTVTIDFGDGNVVKWEKGWNKPGKKGGTINAYTLNGKLLENVGAKCPPEVLSLGVEPIRAGSSTMWPQVADQFKGVLFLIGSAGSATAEAIADVKRVGKLSGALKIAETDKRAVVSTLKVRRKDEESLEKELGSYEGLDDVGILADRTEAALKGARVAAVGVVSASALRDQHTTFTSLIGGLSGIADVEVPGSGRVATCVTQKGSLRTARRLQKDYNLKSSIVENLSGISDVPVPAASKVVEAQEARVSEREALGLRKRVAACQSSLTAAEAAADVASTLSLSSTSKASKTKRLLSSLGDLRDRMVKASRLVGGLEGKLGKAKEALESSRVSVKEILGDMGECPTCGTVTT